MRSQLVAPALAIVREAGGDPRAIGARFGLDETKLDAPEVTMPLASLQALLDAAADASHEPSIGLRIAARYPRGTYGVMEFASRTAPTLRDACASIARYIALSNELVEIALKETADGIAVEQRIPGVPSCLGRHANEFFAGIVTLGAREATGVPIVPERVYLAHPKPREAAELARIFGTRKIDFRAGANGVVFKAATLDLPLLGSDPPLHSLLERQAASSLAARAAPSRFLGRVREAIASDLRRAPNLASIARALGTSPRTLQRRLGEEGSTFAQIVDAVREEAARLAIDGDHAPIASIAASLGYADPRAFLRAFRRWTGTTPSAFKRART